MASFPTPAFVRPVNAPSISGWWSQKRGASKIHQGLDFRVPVGSDVMAIGPGVVAMTGIGHKDMGTWIVVRHTGDGAGFFSRYMHLSKRLVRADDVVAPGQVIGLSGNTGRSTGPHLHVDLEITPELKKIYQGSVGSWFVRPFGYKVPVEKFVALNVPQSQFTGLSSLFGMSSLAVVDFGLGDSEAAGGWVQDFVDRITDEPMDDGHEGDDSADEKPAWTWRNCALGTAAAIGLWFLFRRHRPRGGA